MSAKVCVVTGIGQVGKRLRSPICRRYRVALLGRTQSTWINAADIEGSLSVVCDVADAPSVRTAFDRVRKELIEPTVVIQNAGSGVFQIFFRDHYGRAKSSLSVNVGTLLSRRQKKSYRPWSMEMAALSLLPVRRHPGECRNVGVLPPPKEDSDELAQALAKEFAPQGVHVSYIIVDGLVDIPPYPGMDAKSRHVRVCRP